MCILYILLLYMLILLLSHLHNCDRLPELPLCTFFHIPYMYMSSHRLLYMLLLLLLHYYNNDFLLLVKLLFLCNRSSHMLLLHIHLLHMLPPSGQLLKVHDLLCLSHLSYSCLYNPDWYMYELYIPFLYMSAQLR